MCTNYHNRLMGVGFRRGTLLKFRLYSPAVSLPVCLTVMVATIRERDYIWLRTGRSFSAIIHLPTSHPLPIAHSVRLFLSGSHKGPALLFACSGRRHHSGQTHRKRHRRAEYNRNFKRVPQRNPTPINSCTFYNYAVESVIPAVVV